MLYFRYVHYRYRKYPFVYREYPGTLILDLPIIKFSIWPSEYSMDCLGGLPQRRASVARGLLPICFATLPDRQQQPYATGRCAEITKQPE
jgi:hypothetical protein